MNLKINNELFFISQWAESWEVFWDLQYRYKQGHTLFILLTDRIARADWEWSKHDFLPHPKFTGTFFDTVTVHWGTVQG